MEFASQEAPTYLDKPRKAIQASPPLANDIFDSEVYRSVHSSRLHDNISIIRGNLTDKSTQTRLTLKVLKHTQMLTQQT